MHPNLLYLQQLKEKLCNKRLGFVRYVKSPHWNTKEVEVILKSLKNNRCRDPQGYMIEIFKNGIARDDLKKSKKHILNKIKDTPKIPDTLKEVNVSMIPKLGKEPNEI